MTTTDGMPTPRTKGLVMHSQARYYDLLAGVLTLGRERALRERLVELAGVSPGDLVLDVGCGTGTLAIAAKRRVGTSGTVQGIDASPEMIGLAKRKAAKARLDVELRTAIVEALPFPDASFDVVFSTLMLHHLPRPARQQAAREMHRVLKPGGRVLAADFATPARERKGILAHLHRHGHMPLHDIVELLSDAGLSVVEYGPVGLGDVQFVVASAAKGPGDTHAGQTHGYRALDPLPIPRWMLAVLVVAVVAGHGIVLRAASSRLGLAALAMAAAVVLLIVMHSGFAGALHTLLRRRSRR